MQMVYTPFWLVLMVYQAIISYQKLSVPLLSGGTIPKTNEIEKNICSCHNFFPLSSVQIIFIPACCLLCVL